MITNTSPIYRHRVSKCETYCCGVGTGRLPIRPGIYTPQIQGHIRPRSHIHTRTHNLGHNDRGCMLGRSEKQIGQTLLHNNNIRRKLHVSVQQKLEYCLPFFVCSFS